MQIPPLDPSCPLAKAVVEKAAAATVKEWRVEIPQRLGVLGMQGCAWDGEYPAAKNWTHSHLDLITQNQLKVKTEDMTATNMLHYLDVAARRTISGGGMVGTKPTPVLFNWYRPHAVFQRWKYSIASMIPEVYDIMDEKNVLGPGVFKVDRVGHLKAGGDAYKLEPFRWDPWTPECESRRLEFTGTCPPRAPTCWNKSDAYSMNHTRCLPMIKVPVFPALYTFSMHYKGAAADHGHITEANFTGNISWAQGYNASSWHTLLNSTMLAHVIAGSYNVSQWWMALKWDPDPRSVVPDTRAPACSHPKELPYKVLSTKLREWSPEGHYFLSNMRVTTDDQEEMLGNYDYNPDYTLQPQRQIRRRQIVCDWIRKNRARWKKWIPSSVLQYRCLGEINQTLTGGRYARGVECSGHGTCVPNPRRLHAGDCECQTGWTTLDCSSMVNTTALNVVWDSSELPGQIILLFLVFHGLGVAANMYAVYKVVIDDGTPLFFYCSKTFVLLVILGATIGHASAIPWVGRPDKDMCMLRPVIPAMGFVFVMGATLMKTHRVAAILSGKAPPEKVVTDGELLLKQSMLLVVGMAILLIAWYIAAPPVPVETRLKVRIYESFVECDYGVVGGRFASAVLLYCVLLAVDACILSFQIRNREPLHFNERKHMARATTLITLTLATAAPLMYYFGDLEGLRPVTVFMDKFNFDLARIATVSVCALITGFGSFGYLVAPKLYVLLVDPDSNTIKAGGKYAKGKKGEIEIGNIIAPQSITRNAQLVGENLDLHHKLRDTQRQVFDVALLLEDIEHKREDAELAAETKANEAQEDKITLLLMDKIGDPGGDGGGDGGGGSQDGGGSYQGSDEFGTPRSGDGSHDGEGGGDGDGDQGPQSDSETESSGAEDALGEGDGNERKEGEKKQSADLVPVVSKYGSLQERLSRILSLAEGDEKELLREIAALQELVYDKTLKIRDKRGKIRGLKEYLNDMKKELGRRITVLKRNRLTLMSTCRSLLPTVPHFLEQHNLSEYTEDMTEEVGGMEELLMLTRTELNKFGLKVGHMRRLEQALLELSNVEQYEDPLRPRTPMKETELPTSSEESEMDSDGDRGGGGGTRSGSGSGSDDGRSVSGGSGDDDMEGDEKPEVDDDSPKKGKKGKKGKAKKKKKEGKKGKKGKGKSVEEEDEDSGGEDGEGEEDGEDEMGTPPQSKKKKKKKKGKKR